MSRFKKPKPTTEKAIAYFVKAGKECVHRGQVFKGGDEFTPFEEMPIASQNVHLINLERREIAPTVELSPEEAIAVIDQETETPTDLSDV